MFYQQLIERLRSGLESELPGHDEFLALSGYGRSDIERARQLQPAPRESAVLALIYPKEAVLHCLLMVRPIYDGVHSGQISFPGGKREISDATLMDTALREFREETGAGIDTVDVLGALTPVYIPPSRMLVTPYVGYAERIGPWDPDPLEVDRLIEAPVDQLMRDDVIKSRQQFIQLMGREVNTPYFDIADQVVWGATAMMLSELRQLLRSAHGTDLG